MIFHVLCSPPHTPSCSQQSTHTHAESTLYTSDLSSAFSLVSAVLPLLSLIRRHLYCHRCIHRHILTITLFSFTTLATGSWQNAACRPPKWQQLSWPGIFWAQVKTWPSIKAGGLQQPLYSPETKPGSVVWSGWLDVWIEPAMQRWQTLLTLILWGSAWLYTT